MFDHMIFGAVLASILVVILALLKLAIEFPGCFSWCMRSVHKGTEKHSGGEHDDSGHEDSPDTEHGDHPHLSRRESKVVTRCRSQATMSRTATDPEIAKRRWDIGGSCVWLLTYIWACLFIAWIVLGIHIELCKIMHSLLTENLE